MDGSHAANDHSQQNMGKYLDAFHADHRYFLDMVTQHFNKLLAQPFNCRWQHIGNRGGQRPAQASERIDYRGQQGGDAVAAADE